MYSGSSLDWGLGIGGVKLEVIPGVNFQKSTELERKLEGL